MASRIFSMFLAMGLLSQSAIGKTTDTLDTETLLDMDFESLMDIRVATVYGASKRMQKSIHAPSSVTIVDADEIRDHGYQTLAELLAAQSGFYRYYDRNYDYIGVRGFGRPGDYNTRILVLVDGERTNEAYYDSSALGRDFPIDMQLIKRVEIIRGPGSALYGSSAFFAVINIVTKGVDSWKNGSVQITKAGGRTHKESGILAHTFTNGATLLAAATRYKSKGKDLYFSDYDDPDTNFGIAKGLDTEASQSYFFKSTYAAFTLEGAYIRRDKSIPTAAWETRFNDPSLKAIDTRAYLFLRYDKPLGRAWTIDAQIGYNYYDFDGYYPYEEEDGIAIYRDETPAIWLDTTLDLKYRREKRKWLLGIYLKHDLKNDFRYSLDGKTISEEKNPTDTYAFYLEHEHSFFKTLILNLGMRYDHYESFGGHLSPRAALIYNFQENSALKALFGDAFRAPNNYERTYNDGNKWQKGNPDLKEEKIRTYELIFEHNFQNSDYLSLGGFYYLTRKLISQIEDPEDGLYFFDNIDKVNSRGVELTYKTRLLQKIKTEFNYTYAYATDADSKEWLSNSPRHLANLKFASPLWNDRLEGGVDLHYISRTKSVGGERVDDALITHLHLSSTSHNEGLNFSLDIKNLFDTKYANSGGEEHLMPQIEQDGRRFWLTLGYRF